MIAALRFFYLILFICIASQGIFYFLAAGKALQIISLEGFIEQRNAIDSMIEVPLKGIYYASIAAAISLVLLHVKNFNSVFFLTTSISLIFLLADVFFAVTKSVPLNTLIRNYTLSSDQNLYENIRMKWLFYIKLRGGLAVSGLVILLSGFIHDAHVLEKLK